MSGLVFCDKHFKLATQLYEFDMYERSSESRGLGFDTRTRRSVVYNEQDTSVHRVQVDTKEKVAPSEHNNC